MWMFTNDPAADAEREQVSLEAAHEAWEQEHPEQEYIVEYTVTLRVLATGRDEDEARKDADEKLATVMANPDIWDYDSTEERTERF